MAHHHHHDSDVGEHAAASGMNLLTTLIVILVLAALLWFLFTGPLSGIFGGGAGNGTDTELNPPRQEQPVQPQPGDSEQLNPGGEQQGPGGALPGGLRWAA